MYIIHLQKDRQTHISSMRHGVSGTDIQNSKFTFILSQCSNFQQKKKLFACASMVSRTEEKMNE